MIPILAQLSLTADIGAIAVLLIGYAATFAVMHWRINDQGARIKQLEDRERVSSNELTEVKTTLGSLVELARRIADKLDVT